MSSILTIMLLLASPSVKQLGLVVAGFKKLSIKVPCVA